MTKNIIILAAVILLIMSWDNISRFVSPTPDFAAEHGGKVILYATSWCGYCEKTRQLLFANGVDFFEYDIEASAKGYQQHRALGGKGIPVLLINGNVVKGYDPKRIMELVKSG